MKQIISKYKKHHKVQVKSYEKEYKGLCLLHGHFGLQALECKRLTGGQLESLRRTIKKSMKKLGIMWVRVILDRPITAKPIEVRMGKGKGNFSENIAVIKKGTILVELGGSELEKKVAMLALGLVQQKVGIKTKIIGLRL